MVGRRTRETRGSSNPNAKESNIYERKREREIRSWFLIARDDLIDRCPYIMNALVRPFRAVPSNCLLIYLPFPLLLPLPPPARLVPLASSTAVERFNVVEGGGGEEANAPSKRSFDTPWRVAVLQF